MKISEEHLNVAEFDARTKGKWKGEPLEMFKCGECGMIVLGAPDCHTVFVDASDLSKTTSYNMPRTIRCPNCRGLWYDHNKAQEAYNVEDVTIEELAASDWKWLVKEVPSKEDTGREIVEQFAGALDREDYAAAEHVLSSDCVYLSSSGELRGPGEIVGSYKANGDWGRAALDSVRYESSIKLLDDRRWRITFIDHITHKGQSITYKSYQIVELDDASLIVRIEQAEIPGQRKALEEFFERLGVSRPN